MSLVRPPASQARTPGDPRTVRAPGDAESCVMKHADLEKIRMWNCLQLVRSRRLRGSARQGRARPPNPSRPGLGFGGHAAALRAVPNPAADFGSEAGPCLGFLRFRIGKGRPSSSWLPGPTRTDSEPAVRLHTVPPSMHVRT